jgi:hypothetical protein
MARFLLTLLALLTGLTAVSAQAGARVCGNGGAEIGALEAPLGAVRLAIPGQRINGPKVRQDSLSPDPKHHWPEHLTVWLPAVQLKADRALE